MLPIFRFFFCCVSTVPWCTKNRKYDRSGSLDYIIFTLLIYQVAMIVRDRYYSKTSSHGANPIPNSLMLPFLPKSCQRVLSRHHFGPIYSSSGGSVGNQPQPPEWQPAVHMLDSALQIIASFLRFSHQLSNIRSDQYINLTSTASMTNKRALGKFWSALTEHVNCLLI